MLKEIEAGAVLKDCRALMDQIIAGLSTEEPLVNVLLMAELQLHLKVAASALEKATKPRS